MVYFINSNGVVQSVINTPVTQGSNGIQSITLVATPLSNQVTMSINFQLPNDEFTEPHIMNATQVVIDGVTYNAYNYVLLEALTNLSGYVKVSFSAKDINNNVLKTYNTQFQVIESAQPVLPDAPTIDWYDEMLSAIAYINGQVAIKQNVTDASLDTTSNTIVGAINENKGRLDNVNNDITDITSEINSIQNDIQYLAQNVNYGIEKIGQMTGSVLPEDSALTEKVVKIKNRSPRNGDQIEFVLDSGELIKNYLYSYTADGWTHIEMDNGQVATDTYYGVVQGTYGETDYHTQVKIINGKVDSIYIKDNDNNYSDIRNKINSNETSINNIINGTTTVEKTNKATKDSNGNVFETTYQTKLEGATKQYVKDYALPKAFADIYYLSTDGLVDTIPTLATAFASKSTTAVTQFTLFSKSRTTIYDYEFNKSNSIALKLQLCSSINTKGVTITTTIKCKNANESNYTTLAIETLSNQSFNADEIKTFNVNTTFSSLGDTQKEINAGGSITIDVEITPSSSSETLWEAYSNETYVSSFQFTSASVNVNVNYIGGAKDVNIANTDWTLSNGIYTKTLSANALEIPVKDNYIITADYEDNGVRRTFNIDYSSDSNGNITLYSTDDITCNIHIYSGNVNGSEMTTDAKQIDIEILKESYENNLLQTTNIKDNIMRVVEAVSYATINYPINDLIEYTGGYVTPVAPGLVCDYGEIPSTCIITFVNCITADHIDTCNKWSMIIETPSDVSNITINPETSPLSIEKIICRGDDVVNNEFNIQPNTTYFIEAQVIRVKQVDIKHYFTTIVNIVKLS